MDYYHIWFDLKDSHRDQEFAVAYRAYMTHLKDEGLIEGFRLERRKLGFGPPELGEFHVVIDTRDLAQLERAFQLAATRAGTVESLHRDVYSRVTGAKFGLTRDFPDPDRINQS